MNILLLTLGSAGDVQPFIGLALALQNRGHRVSVATHGYFKTHIERAGLEYIELGTSADYLASLDNPDLWHPRKGFELMVKELILAFLRPAYELIASRDPADTVLVASGFMFAARAAHEKLGLPLATVHLQPASFWSVCQPNVMSGLVLPDWLPQAVKRFVVNAIEKMVLERALTPGTNKFLAELGLPPARRIYSHWMHSPQRVLGLFPDWFAPVQADWPKQTRLTGFINYNNDAGGTLGADIEAFMDSGDPPIVFTPGTAMRHGQRFFEAGIGACQQLGRRGLLLTQHRAQVPSDLPEGIVHADYVPLGAILPRSLALVHHGGIGTLAQGLAAGTPQLVMPMAHDQPDNAARLERLGVGISLTPGKFRTSAVVKKLDYLLRSDGVKRACQHYAGKIDFGGALQNACLEIEQLA